MCFVFLLSPLLLLIPRTQSPRPFLKGQGGFGQCPGHTCLYFHSCPLDCLVNCVASKQLFSTNSVFSKEFFFNFPVLWVAKILKILFMEIFLLPASEPRCRNQASAAGVTWLSLTDNSVFEQSSSFFFLMLLFWSNIYGCKGWKTSNNMG